jgi:hypothetical protein
MKKITSDILLIFIGIIGLMFTCSLILYAGMSTYAAFLIVLFGLTFNIGCYVHSGSSNYHLW